VNLLDENFPEDQRPLLRQWGIRFRQIGRDVGWFGVKDDNVIPLLHERRGVTFFTQDQGFFQLRNCHAAYCIQLKTCVLECYGAPVHRLSR
jgi:hypothetical protein